MQKYWVIVHGQNLQANVDGVRQRLGFYTTVFVEAFNAPDAKARAIELVREDAHLHKMTLNAGNDPLSLSADEIHEAEAFEGDELPRTGFSFYPAE